MYTYTKNQKGWEPAHKKTMAPYMEPNQSTKSNKKVTWTTALALVTDLYAISATSTYLNDDTFFSKTHNIISLKA